MKLPKVSKETIQCIEQEVIESGSTGEFAANTIERLAAENFNVAAVITELSKTSKEFKEISFCAAFIYRLLEVEAESKDLLH